MLDFGLHNKPIVISKVDEAVQELDILFNTMPTEMIGQPSYGVNFLQFLWSLSPNTQKLKKYIRDCINTYTCYTRDCEIEIEVTTEDEESSYSYVVAIYLYDSETNEEKERIYTIRNT